MNSILHYKCIIYLLIFNIFFTTFLLSMPSQETEEKIEQKGQKRKFVNEDNKIEIIKKQKIEYKDYLNQLPDIEAKMFKKLEDNSLDKLVLVFVYHMKSSDVEVLDNFKKDFRKKKPLLEKIMTDPNKVYFPSHVTGHLGDTKNIEYFMVVFNIDEQIMYKHIKLIGGNEANLYKVTSIDKTKKKEDRIRKKENIEKTVVETIVEIPYKVYLDQLSEKELKLFNEVENKYTDKIVLIFAYHRESRDVKILDNFKEHFDNKKSFIEGLLTDSNKCFYSSTITRYLKDTKDVEYFIVVFNIKKQAIYRYLKLRGEEEVVKVLKISAEDKMKRSQYKRNYRKKIKENKEAFLENKNKKIEEVEQTIKNRVYSDKLSTPEIEILDKIKKDKPGELLLMFHFHKESDSREIIEHFRIHYNTKIPLLKKVTSRYYPQSNISKNLGILHNIQYLMITFCKENQTMYKTLKTISREEREIIIIGNISEKIEEAKEKEDVIHNIDFNKLIQNLELGMTYKQLLEFLELDKLNISDDQLRKLEQNFEKEWLDKIKELFTLHHNLPIESNREFSLKSEELRQWVKETVKETQVTEEFISENISTEEGKNDFMKYLHSLIEGVNKLDKKSK